jgi:hypothetical protein
MQKISVFFFWLSSEFIILTPLTFRKEKHLLRNISLRLTSLKVVNYRNILIYSSEIGSLARREENKHKNNKEKQLHNKFKPIIPESIRQARN